MSYSTIWFAFEGQHDTSLCLGRSGNDTLCVCIKFFVLKLHNVTG